MMAAGLLLAGVNSALAGSSDSDAMKKATNDEVIKVSQEVFDTVRNVRSARLAIFNGFPKDAEKFIAVAKSDIMAAVENADEYAIDSKVAANEDDLYVPFDSDIALADSFVPTPKKAEQIKSANSHLKKGNRKEAIEVLKLASIDIVFTAALLPVNLAQAHIDDAASLIGQGKFYEANLALKAVEDLIVVDSYGVDAVPAPKAAKKS